MTESSSHSFARVAWSVLRVGIYVALGGLVLFFALTRTQVGRNQLRQQIQATFDERFQGSLHVGSLQGTLLNQLYATDVRLRDQNGRLVLHIDSVAAQPHWRHLLTAELSIQSLTLVRPHLALHRHADGSWNVRRALTPRHPDSSGRPLDFSFPDLRIQNGRVTTSRAGAAPPLVANRWLFDYSRSELDRINAEATIEWSETNRLIDLNSLQFSLPSKDLALTSAQAEIEKYGSRWRMDEFSFQLGNSRIESQGLLQPSPRNPDRWALDLKLAQSQLDHEQLRRLMPRLPLRKVVTVEGRIGGSLNRFVVNELIVSHAQSFVTIEGTGFGLPDSLDVDAQIQDSQVRPSDVQAVWPAAPLDQVETIGPVQLEASVSGLVEWGGRAHPSYDLEGTLSAHGTPGAVRGSLDVRGGPHTPLNYRARMEVDSLNLAPLTGRSRLDSRLTGHLAAEGTGMRPASFRGTVNASFSSSRVGPRPFAAADLHLTVDQQQTEGTLTVQQPSGGFLTAQGTFDPTPPVPVYNGSVLLTDFNLAAAHPPLPSSQLNATLALDGRGTSWSRLSGQLELAVDSSSLHRDDQPIPLPPHRAALTVSDTASASPRVQLDGTIASGKIEGRPLHPGVERSGWLWARTLRQAVQQELARATRSGPDSLSPPSVKRPPLLDNRADAAFARSDTNSPIRLDAELAIHRMDLLRKWWPRAPEEGSDLRITSQLLLGPDTLDASGTLAASHLQIGSRRADSLDASYALSGPSGPLQSSLFEGLTTRLSARADTLQLGSRSLVRPSVTVRLDQRTGTLEARVDEVGRTGPHRLTSAVHLNRGLHFQITDLVAEAGRDTWTTADTGTISVYSDAVKVDSLKLSSPRPAVASTQNLKLYGTLSPASSDTLHAEMDGVLLYPLGELASLPRSLGGRLTGHVALTGGWNQPQVRSSFRVHRLTFDRRVLGDLRVRSRLSPDAPDLLVDAALTPGPDSLDGLEGPSLVPGGPRTIEKNRLQMRGRVRLPGWQEESASPSDQLDLRVNVERADLFFFKYIFEENLAKARGYTAGQIHVEGRFRRPVFNAQMEVYNGRFSLPQFGLAYSASGPVEVDRRGIHLQDLSVEDEQGSATITGSILFNEYRYFSFDLAAELDQLTIVDVTDAEDLAFYGNIRASGTASLTGPLQDATLRSEGARTTPDSELFIPVSESSVDAGTGFIVFADSTGKIPNLRDLTRRDNILSDRPEGEPSFLEGLEIDINVLAPEESTVHLVFDPVVGDVVTAVGSGRVQLQRQEGEFYVYGNYNVSGGNYLFTAGEVFVRRFNINEGTITWDGPPTNAQLDLEAEYRTRASTAGLDGFEGTKGRIPVRVLLDIGGRVETPRVDLSLARVRDDRNNLVGSQTLDAILNQADRTTEYATSVLLTNTFLLTTDSFTQGQSTGAGGTTSGSLVNAGRPLAFNSVSQLVASQLNRYLGAALPNVDLNFGLQGENPNDLDLIYGIALRLLNERLVIRGEGVYTGDDPSTRQTQGPQGEFVVEVRLSNRVSAEAFYRRTGDELTQGQTLTSSTGAGLSYQTEFSTWHQLFGRVFGWLFPGLRVPVEDPAPEEASHEEDSPNPVARREDSTSASSAAEDKSDG